MILFLIVPLLLAGCSTQAKNTLSSLSDVKLADNQTLVTGQVKSIQGNEVVLDEGTYRSMQRPAGTNGGGSSTGESAQATPAAGSSGGTSSSQNFSAGLNGSTGNTYVSGSSYAGSSLGSNHTVSFTDSSGQSIKNTGGFGNFGTQSSNTNAASRPSASGGTDTANQENQTASGRNTAGTANYAGSASRFQSTGQTLTVSIPVGTQVVMTSSGSLTTTTFGRIQADDIIEAILQKNADGSQTVLEVEIMG